MRLITWNVQWGKGCDGIVDPRRIAHDVAAMGGADILCFQEMSCRFDELDGGVDQDRIFAELFPYHRSIFRPAVERHEGDVVRRFGNMTFSRFPVRQVSNHLLPWPAASSVKSMRRHALEVVIETPLGPVRVTNTHLEFHSDEQRRAQVERLVALQDEAVRGEKPVKSSAREPYAASSLVQSAILCGDFNLEPDDPLYNSLDQPERGDAFYRDVWRLAHPGEPHAPTCGIFDADQWPKGPNCRDFVFVSGDLGRRIARVTVDDQTSSSDHQPVLVAFRIPS
ncbi:MAG: endonuclease/exonuclease/phosphatase family protein [Pseudorhodoplanes sp.]|nr:endonuclease/exonuclease/phosphatase family protein [Pseudorhodoplanes sp.]